MEPYKIGKVKPNYVSIETFQGVEFHLHRPVSNDFEKIKDGWQFSYRGIPLHEMSDVKARPSAISRFKKLLAKKAVSDERWAEYVHAEASIVAAELGLTLA